MQWEINFGVFESRHALLPVAAQPSLLFVDAERVSGSIFQHFLSELHAAGRLDRIVLDEAHLLLTASHYRESLPALAVLRRYRCPFVCLTATLPPRAEREFRRLLCLTPKLEKLRASSNRPNLAYDIRRLPAREGGLRRDQSSNPLLDASILLCRALLEQYEGSTTARIICYVRQKLLGSVLAEEVGAYLYHAGLEDREENLSAWRLGTKSPMIVATTALGAGMDYASVRCVLHIDAPAGMVDYAQETGRAGRDGARAECIVLLPPRWEVTWARGFQTDFLVEDCRQMTQYLQSSATQCLRQQITSYLDGGQGVLCLAAPAPGSTATVAARCDHCIQSYVTSTPPSASEGEEYEEEASYTGNQVLRTAQHSHIAQEEEEEDTQAVQEEDERPQEMAEEDTHAVQEEDEWPHTYDGGEVEELTHSPADDEEESHAVDEEDSESHVSEEDSESHVSDEEGSHADDEDADRELVYSLAEANLRLQAMQRSAGLQLYQDRVTAWKPACIPCSFRQGKPIIGMHADCTRDTDTIRNFRITIKFAKYIGCWTCGQPALLCDRRKTPCDRSELIFDVCHFALLSDSAHAAAILHALGCPPTRLGSEHTATHLHADTTIPRWLGEKSRLYTTEASNAARFTHHWLDRLHSRL